MVPSHIYCSACGAANEAKDAFCFACGQPLRVTTPLPQYPVSVTTSSTQTGLLTTHHLLNKRYRILEVLGKGGFGAVYKAEDVQFGNRFVAVKEMSQSNLSSEEMKEAAKAFEYEALMLAGLRHQNLPRIYDHFQDSGRWYLVMDFIEGHTLSEHLKKSKGGYLSVEEALRIGIQLCTVLNYLHTCQPPVIFRDLKPDNIMLTPDGHVYLIDFGIARLFKPGKTKDTIAFGSVGYAAPEQYGKTQTTPCSDIYSLGALLHQLLTGNDPTTNTPTQFDFPGLKLPSQSTPAPLETLIMRMVEKDSSKRPQNADEVKRELQQILAQQTTGQMRNSHTAGKPPLPTPQPVAGTLLSPIQRVKGRKGIIALIGGIVAAILIVALIISTLSIHSWQVSSQTTSNNSSAISASAPTALPTPTLTVVPTPTPTPIPSPTPTPPPKPGTVLCQPKANAWPQNGAWQAVGTEYVYKENGTSPPVVAPCTIPVSDYTVEAQIRTSELTTSLMWVVARFDQSSGAGYMGGIGVGVLCNDCIHAELNDMLNSQRNTAEFGQFSVNTVYTIKLQVKGTDESLYVNNGFALEEHYTSANDAGQVGVECDQSCEILQFTVVAV